MGSHGVGISTINSLLLEKFGCCFFRDFKIWSQAFSNFNTVKMVCTRAIYVLSAFLSLTTTTLGNVPDLGRHAPFEPFGIDKRGQEAIADDEFIAGFAPEAQEGKKNATQPLLMDRSLELSNRQTCNSGYAYCSSTSSLKY